MEQLEKSPLRQVIMDRIAERGGRITFEEYMHACLYEPGLGYYTSPGRKVGAEGDFYTSINVHRVFGRVIAREICRMWENMGSPERFELVECGAAAGVLANDILDTISELAPDLYSGVTYRLVEMEPSLRDAQRETLASHLPKLAWSEPAELEAGSLTFTGCYLSNELVDSFPTHLVEMTPQGLREAFVAVSEAGFAEQLDNPSTPELQAYLERITVRLPVGQRAEINLNAPRWVNSVAKALTQGFVLTIDYGYLAPELYGSMRPNGTLLCYYRHTTVEDPYIRPGLQDITTHVDFSTLIRAGEEVGLHKVWYGEQYRFLMAAGLMEEMMALEAQATTEEEKLKNRLALKKLILTEGGMGDTFKVLIQAKGVAAPSLLCQREWGKLL
ncbi:MAG: SAM-dependent methyltransferase [Geobacter sp.]|nr:SAM-dependent methyltransferase [Geobacter sp.]